MKNIPITLILIATNIFLFFLASVEGSIFHLFAADSLLIREGEYWRMLTAIFLHMNSLHLAFNTAALLSLGMSAEKIFSGFRYLSLFLISGIGGSFSSAFFRHQDVIAAGSSGAIYGIIGGLIIDSLIRRDRSSFKKFAPYALLSFILTFSFADNHAHVGGFISGICLGMILHPKNGIV